MEGNLAGGVAAGADVIYGAYVAAVKTEAGTEVEHVSVGWVGWREGKWVYCRDGGRIVECEGGEVSVEIVKGY